MILPEFVFIGPYRIKLVADDAEMDKVEFQQKAQLNGCYEGSKHKITLRNESLGPQAFLEVLCHEIAHAIIGTYDPQNRASYTDEEVAYIFGVGMLDFIKHNERIIRNILEVDNEEDATTISDAQDSDESSPSLLEGPVDFRESYIEGIRLITRQDSTD